MRNHLFYSALIFMLFKSSNMSGIYTGMLKVHFPMEDQVFQKSKTHFQIQTTNPVLRLTLSITFYPPILLIFICLLVPLPQVECKTFTWHFLCTHHSSMKWDYIDSCNSQQFHFTHQETKVQRGSNLPEISYPTVEKLEFEPRRFGSRVYILQTLLFYT